MNQIPIQPDDLYRMKFLQGGTLSADGKRVVYARTCVDTDKDAEMCALHELDLESGATRALTDGASFDTEPRFSPDGKWLAFRSNRSGADQIYLMESGSGGVRSVTALARGVSAAFDWSVDGRFIAFSAPPEKEVVNLHIPYRITRHVYRMDGMGYVDNAINSIYIVEVATGALTRLTNDACHNTIPKFSPDGAEILFETSIFPDSHRFFPALRIVDLKGSVRDLVKDWGYVRAGAWSHDGKQVVFIGNPIEAHFGQHNLMWTIDCNGGVPECRTPNAGVINFGGELQPDIPIMGLSEPTIYVTQDEVAYTRAQVGGEMRAYRINLCNEVSFERVFETAERTDVVLDIRAGRILFGIATINDPLNLGIADINGKNERIVTDTNGELMRDRKLARIEHFFCKNETGTSLECWLMLPAKGSAPYPTIQYIHGGPHQGWGQIYVFDAQMLAGAGFAVLLVNYRGSTGYGDEFGFAADGKQGPTEHSDLMCALDYVIEKGWADPNRLGTAGISYGGYLSNWAIGNTERYKAAVVENGISSRINSYGAADMGVYSVSNELRAHLRDAPELFWKSSPIAYAHLAKTPTLLIQSEHDWRVPAAQAEEMYGNLKANGCVVEMLRLPYMPHMGSLGGPLYIRRAQNDALLDWMNRYVLPSQSGKRAGGEG